MIERFYDPSEGIVEYCGVDIRLLNIHWYRDQIGFVGQVSTGNSVLQQVLPLFAFTFCHCMVASQEPTLFNDTIERNIAYGCPDITQEEIEEAAMQANAHSFITNFPDGYKTLGTCWFV
jgi:ABC-type multidrug transport system fused ATPase/permease subunit